MRDSLQQKSGKTGMENIARRSNAESAAPKQPLAAVFSPTVAHLVLPNLISSTNRQPEVVLGRPILRSNGGDVCSIPVLPLFCCNESRITIFPGTCEALISLR